MIGREDEDLGLAGQTPKRRRVQDPVPIALETGRHGSPCSSRARLPAPTERVAPGANNHSSSASRASRSRTPNDPPRGTAGGVPSEGGVVYKVTAHGRRPPPRLFAHHQQGCRFHDSKTTGRVSRSLSPGSCPPQPIESSDRYTLPVPVPRPAPRAMRKPGPPHRRVEGRHRNSKVAGPAQRGQKGIWPATARQETWQASRLHLCRTIRSVFRRHR